MKNLNKILWLLAIIMLLIVLLYFIKFHGKLSDSKADWGTFGDYLSGVFAMFNLAIVIFLAFYIKITEDERRQEDIIFQNQRHEAENNFNQYRLAKELENQQSILKIDIEYRKKVALLELNFDYLKSFEKSFDNFVCNNHKDKLECMLYLTNVWASLLNMTTAFELEQIPSLLGEETSKFSTGLGEIKEAILNSTDVNFFDVFSREVVDLTDLKLNFVRKFRESLLKAFD